VKPGGIGHLIRNRTVRDVRQFTAPAAAVVSNDFHSFHMPSKKEKEAKKKEMAATTNLFNSPLAPRGHYYKGIFRAVSTTFGG
jgi:hypothetical protein